MLEQIADNLVKTFGSNCEVAIHDLSHLRHSLVYLAGNVTNRQLGAPISDLVVEALIKEGSKVKDRHGYKTILDDGRELKSSTCFIRNESGKVIAAFSINFDTTDYVNAIHALDLLARFSESGQSSAFSMTSFRMASEKPSQYSVLMLSNTNTPELKYLLCKTFFSRIGVSPHPPTVYLILLRLSS